MRMQSRRLALLAVTAVLGAGAATGLAACGERRGGGGVTVEGGSTGTVPESTTTSPASTTTTP